MSPNRPNLFFVDCEATGDSPVTGTLCDVGAVHLPTMETFRRIVVPYHLEDTPTPILDLGDLREPDPVGGWYCVALCDLAFSLQLWVRAHTEQERPVFVSDNPAYDWQWVAAAFAVATIPNPFGHSGRRIGDFAAGLAGDWHRQNRWKRLRRTPHDHNPANDAMGNAEAWLALTEGERP